MTREELINMINQIGASKLIGIKYNNNLVQLVYGVFNPETDIVDIGGVDYMKITSQAAMKYDDGKGPITTTEYKPMFTIEGLEFIDDETRMGDIDRWMNDRK